MSDQRNGGIVWTDTTWNPIRGCSKVSQGCKNCYAETMAVRFSKPGQPYAEVITDGRWNGKVVLVPEHLADPLRWTRPRRVFVNSMSDLFHPSVSFETIAAIFGVMAAAPRHTFQVLTKRPERALEWFAWFKQAAEFHAIGCDCSDEEGRLRTLQDFAARAAGVNDALDPTPWLPINACPWPLPNVWLGVSVEDQVAADERIPLLLQCPAAVRWVSAEPLLGAMSLSRWVFNRRDVVRRLMNGPAAMNEYQADAAASYPLSWVVVGGESGPGARPMHPDWARSLRDQCQAAGVPFLFKQWGDWSDVGDAHEIAERGIAYAENERCVNLNGNHGFHGPSPRRMRRVGKKAAGRMLDGVTYDGYPNEKNRGDGL